MLLLLCYVVVDDALYDVVVADVGVVSVLAVVVHVDGADVVYIVVCGC